MISSTDLYKYLKKSFLKIFEIYFSGEVFNLIMIFDLINLEIMIEKKFD